VCCTLFYSAAVSEDHSSSIISIFIMCKNVFFLIAGYKNASLVQKNDKIHNHSAWCVNKKNSPSNVKYLKCTQNLKKQFCKSAVISLY